MQIINYRFWLSKKWAVALFREMQELSIILVISSSLSLKALTNVIDSSAFQESFSTKVAPTDTSDFIILLFAKL